MFSLVVLLFQRQRIRVLKIEVILLLSVGFNYAIYLANIREEGIVLLFLILNYTSFLILIQSFNKQIEFQVNEKIKKLRKIVYGNKINKHLISTMRLILSVEKYIYENSSIINKQMKKGVKNNG